MTLSEVFAGENIIPEMEATQKDAAIRELLQRLQSSGSLPKGQVSDIEHALLRREELGSTGIGKGIGVPHAKHAGVKGVVGALGRSTQGVEFAALDGQPVHLIFLLLSSPDAVEANLEALRKVTMLLKDDDIFAFMRRAKSRTELSELLRESEERLRN